jgi:hypothetical protein
MIQTAKEFSPDGFINMLTSLNGGAVVQELDRAIIDGLQSIHDNGGKAEINLCIKMGQTQGLEKTITIEDSVKTKFPKEKRAKSLMFVTHGNGLVTQVQEQQKLELSPAEQKPASLQKAEASKVSHINKQGA